MKHITTQPGFEDTYIIKVPIDETDPTSKGNKFGYIHFNDKYSFKTELGIKGAVGFIGQREAIGFLNENGLKLGKDAFIEKLDLSKAKVKKN